MKSKEEREDDDDGDEENDVDSEDDEVANRRDQVESPKIPANPGYAGHL